MYGSLAALSRSPATFLNETFNWYVEQLEPALEYQTFMLDRFLITIVHISIAKAPDVIPVHKILKIIIVDEIFKKSTGRLKQSYIKEK